MAYKKITMEKDKRIALVAHDNEKRDLVEWAKFNRDLLAHHTVYATARSARPSTQTSRRSRPPA